MGESRFKPKVPISRAHPINHHARWLPPDPSAVANPTDWNWILEVEVYTTRNTAIDFYEFKYPTIAAKLGLFRYIGTEWL